MTDVDATVAAKAEELAALKEEELSKASAMSPKSWFTDPYALMDSLGLGYRSTPSTLSYESLKQMGEREPIIAAIIQTRVHQVAAFCKPQPNKYSIGYVVRNRDYGRRKMTEEDKKRIHFFERLMMDSGRSYNRSRDGLIPFIKKVVRDSLIYDQVNVECVRNSIGGTVAWYAVPADTIRMAAPKYRKGTPLDVNELKRTIKYAQVVDGAIVNEYTEDEMIFAVRNPRTDMRVYGYGFSELEQLMRIVTALLWGVDWNLKQFSQGATMKGILNMKGNIPAAQLEGFKRQWYLQTAGVSNAFKTPVLNTDGIEWMPLQLNNQEMGYQQWLEFLIKVASAIFLIDPAEINFDTRGGMQQPLFMSTNEAQQKVSKDRGLAPLLNFFADLFNRYIIWPEDDRYEFAFVGLDAKTEEQAIELRLKAAQSYKTLNEVRQEDDLPPVDHGDAVMNPTYTGFVMGQKQMEQQQAAMAAQQGGQGGPPGAPGGAPPPPGGAPVQGAAGGQPQPPKEVGAKMFKKPHTEVEHKAGQDAENDAQSRPEETITGRQRGPHEEADFGMEDWETSTHQAALPEPTLKKALDALFEMEPEEEPAAKLKKSSTYDLIDAG